ncbi:MAG: metallophosphoesterase [Peptococcaceae bacterium]|jgi:predicted phosphohydrolase|nr:metallophosphoesterase [Peptococcaceae bacterium]
MKIQYLSDLHAEFGFSRSVRRVGDVLLVAGDLVARPERMAGVLDRLPAVPTLIVAGNHEFYGHPIGQATIDAYRQACLSHCHVLENQAVEIGGVRFLAATLWTDFARGTHAGACQEMMNDFYRITVAEDGSRRRIRPEDFAALHRRTVEWLTKELSRAHPRTVVLTHHAPSFRSLALRFVGSPLNGGFCVDLEELIETYQPQVWIHGHLHDSADYALGRTRIVCNPYGYEGREENRAFDPGAVVEV